MIYEGFRMTITDGNLTTTGSESGIEVRFTLSAPVDNAEALVVELHQAAGDLIKGWLAEQELLAKI